MRTLFVHLIVSSKESYSICSYFEVVSSLDSIPIELVFYAHTTASEEGQV
jgi:hypothetical protein